MKTRLSAAAVTAAVAVTLSPTIANADAIDDALNRIPAGEISCEQAEAYWTTEDEYNSIRGQAQAFALFDRRGAEINDALSRVEEAAVRCGLKGGGGAPAPAQPPVNNQATNTAPNPGAPAPGPVAPAQPAPPAEAVNVGVAPGTPYVTVPAGPVTVVIPDVLTIIEQAIAQVAAQANVQLPNLPNAGSSF